MVSSLDLRALGLFSVSLSALFLCEGLLFIVICDILILGNTTEPLSDVTLGLLALMSCEFPFLLPNLVLQ